jgi:hypothetical protein
MRHRPRSPSARRRDVWRLARIALDEAGSFGFALAGGYAVQAHGFLNRRSCDVDLFAEASADFKP